jgi:HEAT repeat protein
VVSKSQSNLISRETLDQRIRDEVAALEPDQLSWWIEHRIEPFVVTRDGHSHYAVTRSDGQPLMFFHRHDLFGQHAEEPWSDTLVLDRNLADSVRRLMANESLSRLLSDTASALLKLGLLDGDDRGGIRRRAMEILAAFGPDAAVAAPRLIELLCQDNSLGILTERTVATLSAIGPAAAPAVPKLIEMAKADTANARGWCIQAFSTIGPPARLAVPLLIDLLLKRIEHDPDAFYVSMAADALGNIQAIESLPALLQVLRETDDADIASSVVRAIGKLGATAIEAVPLLIELSSDHPVRNRFYESADVRRAVEESLRRLQRPMSSDQVGF